MALASELIADHLKRHAKAARQIRSAIRPFFVDQTAWILSTIDPAEPLVPEIIGAGWDGAAAHADLIERLSILQTIAEAEADRVMAEHQQIVTIKLFQPFVDYISSVVSNVLSAEWWHDVARGGIDAAKRIIGRTIDKDGPIPVDKNAAVKAALGTRLRKLAKYRIDGISDGEANGAINLGVQAAGANLELTTTAVQKKTWVTMHDDRVRDTHAALHMTSVDTTANFSVGGHDAPHPGYWELPIGERIHCFPGDTRVEGVLESGYRASYRGVLAKVVTRSGRSLTLTPNHPVFTTEGVIAAGDLESGQKLVAYDSQVDRSVAPGPGGNQVQHKPPVAEDVFESLASRHGGLRSVEVRCAQVNDFDGDAMFFDNDIEIVGSARKLLRRGVSSQFDECGDTVFADVDLGLVAEPAQGEASLVGVGLCGASHGVMRGGDLPLSRSLAHSRPLERFGGRLVSHDRVRPRQAVHHGLATHAERLGQGVDGLSSVVSGLDNRVVFDDSPLLAGNGPCLRNISHLDARLPQSIPDSRVAYAKMLRQFLRRGSGFVSLDEIVDVEFHHGDISVYDFTSPRGWIVANGLVISNCRCFLAYGTVANDISFPIPEPLREAV